jgi:hypothetical protein
MRGISTFVFLEQQRLIADATDQAIGQNFEHVTGQLTGLTSAVYTQRMSQIVQSFNLINLKSE